MLLDPLRKKEEKLFDFLGKFSCDRQNGDEMRERGRGGESFKESEMLKVVALSDFEGGGGW